MVNKEILEFVEENDVKFIRLGFCDPLGHQKNISILSNEIEHAFTDGIAFDASAVPAFSDVTNSDLLLMPDENTLSLLPWRPNRNAVLRFYCDIKNTDGTPYASDARQILQNSIKRLKKLGFSAKLGTECEFYLFKLAEDGTPTKTPIDNGGYLDIAPLDKGENLRREVCLCLEEMGLHPRTSCHEQGPGQNKINFKFSDVLSSADNMMAFKSMVKSIASRNDLFASFMPKPFLDKSGNGLHINISLYKDNVNIFGEPSSENYKYAEYFIAGILDKIAEITLFLNPNNNSYERFGHFKAPKYISWSHQNRSQLLRIPSSSKGRERMELRSADPTINPYLAFALILEAGIYGIKNELALPDAVNENLYTAQSSVTDTLKTLPKNLGEAILLAENSDFVKKHLSEELLEKYLTIKKLEFDTYEKASVKSAYYDETYFSQL